MFREFIGAIGRKIPSQCAVCHIWPASVICEDCIATLAQPADRCNRCALPLQAGENICGACLVNPPLLVRCHAAVSYEYPWDKLIQEFKFSNHPARAFTFAMLMKCAPWIDQALENADLILPMPLSKARLNERGFNQAYELSMALDAGKTKHDLLLRLNDTAPQSRLKLSDRLQNVRHAFAANPQKSKELLNQRVLLVDDVMTSGASLHAAAKALLDAGASEVGAIVFARTDDPHN